MNARLFLENRRTWLLAAALAALFVLARPAKAGGWAVITLHEWPANVRAGEPVRISFSLRGHGQVLLEGQHPVVRAVHAASGERLRVPADPGLREGEYEAVLEFPLEGAWEWDVTFDGAPVWAHPLPPLSVGAGAAAGGPQADPRVNARAMTALSGLLALLLGAAAFTQQRSRWSAGLAVVGLALVVLSPAVFADRPARAAEADAAESGLTLHEYGQVLFQAKGCVVCHMHAGGRDGYEGIQSNIGPDLTGTQLPAEYIREWLADPQALKPKTVMPDLELSAPEIEALAAFLVKE